MSDSLGVAMESGRCDAANRPPCALLFPTSLKNPMTADLLRPSGTDMLEFRGPRRRCCR